MWWNQLKCWKLYFFSLNFTEVLYKYPLLCFNSSCTMTISEVSRIEKSHLLLSCLRPNIHSQKTHPGNLLEMSSHCYCGGFAALSQAPYQHTDQAGAAHRVSGVMLCPEAVLLVHLCFEKFDYFSVNIIEGDIAFIKLSVCWLPNRTVMFWLLADHTQFIFVISKCFNAV